MGRTPPTRPNLPRPAPHSGGGAASGQPALDAPAPDLQAASNLRLRVMLTPAQLRLVNAALAQWEAVEHEPGDGYSQPVMDRTRAAVGYTMNRWGVEP